MFTIRDFQKIYVRASALQIDFLYLNEIQPLFGNGFNFVNAGYFTAMQLNILGIVQNECTQYTLMYKINVHNVHNEH